jgi:hypothetical protein
VRAIFSTLVGTVLTLFSLYIVLCVIMPKHKSRRNQRRYDAKYVPLDSTSQPMFQAMTDKALSTVRGEQSDVIVRKLTNSGLLASNGAGIIANTLSLNPTSYSGWSSLAPIYDEFRVVGARIRFFSHQANSATNATSTAVVVFDNDDNSTNLTALNDGLDYRVNHMFGAVWDTGLGKQLTAYRTPIAADGNWLSTGNASALPCSFKVWCGNLSVSTNYLDWTIELVVQFRGSNV